MYIVGQPQISGELESLEVGLAGIDQHRKVVQHASGHEVVDVHVEPARFDIELPSANLEAALVAVRRLRLEDPFVFRETEVERRRLERAAIVAEEAHVISTLLPEAKERTDAATELGVGCARSSFAAPLRGVVQAHAAGERQPRRRPPLGRRVGAEEDAAVFRVKIQYRGLGHRRRGDAVEQGGVVEGGPGRFAIGEEQVGAGHEGQSGLGRPDDV